MVSPGAVSSMQAFTQIDLKWNKSVLSSIESLRQRHISIEVHAVVTFLFAYSSHMFW